MKIDPALIVNAYIDMALQRIAMGYEPVLLSFMFNQMSGSRASRREQMDREVVKAYDRALSRMFRHPGRIQNISVMPLWIVCPDWPVPKADKDHYRDLSVNDGEHRHAAALVPPSRLKTSFADYLYENQRHFTGGDRPTWRIDAVTLSETPERAIAYALKSLTRGRIDPGDIYVLPRVASEL